MSEVKDISQVIDTSLQEYNNASFKVIKDLQAKISKLEAEKESLLHMLEQNTPSLVNVADLGLGISNEVIICETQICLLKDAAVTRSLTMEEAKKLQIFTDVLSKYKKPPVNPEAIKVESLSNEALMKAVADV